MFKQLAIVALAGTALAHPQNARRGGDAVATVYETVYETAYVTQGAPVVTPAAATVVVVTVPTAAPSTTAAAFFYANPAPAAAPVVAAAPAAVPAASSGSGYIAIVNQWLSACGVRTLTEDSKLQANAQDTVDSSAGSMVHKLNPGSMAQVLAPGSASDFMNVFVGGWLCERPSLLDNAGGCSSHLAGWSHDGETGHADILTSSDYSKIGCAVSDGIWGCDLA